MLYNILKLILLLFNIFVFINSLEILDDSIKIESSINKIQLKLKNGQIIIGNRKLVKQFYNFTIKTQIVYEFLGLPFAQSPINENRFKFPIRLNKTLTQDIYDASYYRPSCMQEYDFTFPGFKGSEMWNPPYNVSEDCLFFNIWVPVSPEQDNLLFKNNSYNNTIINYIQNAFSTLPKKTTMFWIYGGSFNSGSANLKITDGTLLAALENVITITTNYRVGPFGFFYLNSSLSPGNAGLADQLLALQWYKENYMDYFGGSGSDICLFGESAGSMSIHYLLLSNKSSLFSRAIFQSISAYLDISFRTPYEAYQTSLSFAEKLGCLKLNTNNNTQQDTVLQIRLNKLKSDKSVTESELNELNDNILKCMLKFNSSYLSQKQFEIEYVNEHLKMQFIPTLDYHKLIQHDPTQFNFNDYKTKFLNHSLLIGVNQDEASYFTFYYYNNVYYNLTHFLKQNLKYNNQFVTDRLLESLKTRQPLAINYDSVDTKSKIPELNVSIKSTQISSNTNNYFYEKFVNCLSNIYTYKNNLFLDSNGKEYSLNLDQASNSKNNLTYLAWKKINKIIGDYIYYCPTIKLANKFSELGLDNTFFYKFNRRSKSNEWPEWMGVMHGYEIEYVFGSPWVEAELFENEDRQISRKMMNIWANFARDGKLYSKFDIQSNRSNYIEIESTNFNFKNLTENEEYNLFNKYYVSCEFLNEINKKDSYSARYEKCLNYQGLSINSSISWTKSFNTFLISLSGLIIYQKFFYF